MAIAWNKIVYDYFLFASLIEYSCSSSFLLIPVLLLGLFFAEYDS
jgi:hypothetical protein